MKKARDLETNERIQNHTERRITVTQTRLKCARVQTFQVPQDKEEVNKKEERQIVQQQQKQKNSTHSLLLALF